MSLINQDFVACLRFLINRNLQKVLNISDLSKYSNSKFFNSYSLNFPSFPQPKFFCSTKVVRSGNHWCHSLLRNLGIPNWLKKATKLAYLDIHPLILTV